MKSLELHISKQDLSFGSFDDTGKLFWQMNFGEVAEKFKMDHTRMSYVCRHEVGEAVLEETCWYSKLRRMLYFNLGLNS